MNKPYLIDFFCGCGGTSQGFKDSKKWKIAMGIDIDLKASESYKENFKQSGFITKDISNVTEEEFLAELEKYVPNYKKETFGFSLCAPCQPFSTNNRNRFSEEDKRLNLLDETIRFIDLINPKYIFLENVPGIKVTQENGPFANFLNHIKKIGYEYKFDIFKASEFGVPQNRKRLILIASKQKEKFNLPKPTHSDKDDKLKPFTTVKQAFEKEILPELEAGEKSITTLHHEARNLSDLNIERMKNTSHDGGSRKEWPEHLVLECHKKTTGFGNVYGRMAWDKPAPTLTTNCTNITSGRFGHPTEDRGISVLEAMLIQTFPADYKLVGSLGDKSRQVGNAVPPLLAKVFANFMIKELS